MSSEPARLFRCRLRVSDDVGRLPPWRTWRETVEAQPLRPLNFATKPNEGMEAIRFLFPECVAKGSFV